MESMFLTAEELDELDARLMDLLGQLEALPVNDRSRARIAARGLICWAEGRLIRPGWRGMWKRSQQVASGWFSLRNETTIGCHDRQYA